MGSSVASATRVGGDAPLPAHTMLNVTQLAWPGMLVEIDGTRVVGVRGDPDNPEEWAAIDRLRSCARPHRPEARRHG